MTLSKRHAPSPPLQPPSQKSAVYRRVIARHPVACCDYLMPLEAVAKAIFVKANGLSAYHLATGLPLYAKPPGEPS